MGSSETVRERLSATEARLAALVARGRTNAEIAVALALPATAVEARLAEIYRKLGVRSRTELALLLDAGEGEKGMSIPAPYQVAEESFVIPRIVPAPFVGNVHVNTLVITGREPVVVDTGIPAQKKEWLEQLWSVVDPSDVRWVYLSHEDGDHIGGLFDVLDACPNARLVTSWFQLGRMEVGAPRTPDPARCVWVNHGESFHAGDHTLTALRPPFFDSPTTRGLYDRRTRMYYSADSFGAFVPHHVEYASDLSEVDWREGLLALNRVNHPWHVWVDERKWAEHVKTVQRLDLETIVTAHGPAITSPMIATAFDLIRQVPRLSPWPEPTQDDLELLLTGAPNAAAHHIPLVPPSARTRERPVEPTGERATG